MAQAVASERTPVTTRLKRALARDPDAPLREWGLDRLRVGHLRESSPVLQLRESREDRIHEHDVDSIPDLALLRKGALGPRFHPYRLQPLDFARGELERPEYTCINPFGHIPSIDDDGFAVFESAAILDQPAPRADAVRASRRSTVQTRQRAASALATRCASTQPIPLAARSWASTN